PLFVDRKRDFAVAKQAGADIVVVRIYPKDIGMIFRHSSSASHMRAKWMVFGSSVPTKQTMLVSLRGNKSERSAQRHGRRGQRTCGVGISSALWSTRATPADAQWRRWRRWRRWRW